MTVDDGEGGVLAGDVVKLEAADEANVDLLVEWTLDPVAQGPFKRVPGSDAAALRALFLHSADRRYYLIRDARDGRPLGRFYCRAWRLGDEEVERKMKSAYFWPMYGDRDEIAFFFSPSCIVLGPRKVHAVKTMHDVAREGRIAES